MIKLFLSLSISVFLFLFTHSRPALGGEWEARQQEIQRLQSSLAGRPHDPDLLWELARNYYNLGNLETDKEKGLDAYRKCRDYSKKSLAIKENSAQAHFWLGLCYGKEAGVEGGLSGLSFADKIKNEMTRVIELDPNYSSAGGHRALGKLFSRLPRIAGGDTDQAQRHLEEAVRIAPDFSTNHLYLAEVYLQRKNYDLAYKEIETVMNRPFDSMDPATIAEEKKKAKSLLMDIPTPIRKKLATAKAENKFF
ncbi:MAG: tetratricopeptide repeat protein [Nitrospinae bacterium]|nr:tetratricopeptide repeat protein [Nitrospinota bacterium]